MAEFPQAPILDILAPLYAAVSADTRITSALGLFNGVPSIHTRRPVPVGATYPMVVIGPIITQTDLDGLADNRPRITIDINAYGQQPDKYRAIEVLGQVLRQIFHRQRRAISVDGYSVTAISAAGPYPAPTDDEKFVGRRITLTIDLKA